MAQCAHCGSEIPHGTKFCPNCGQAQNASEAVVATQASEEPSIAHGQTPPMPHPIPVTPAQAPVNQPAIPQQAPITQPVGQHAVPQQPFVTQGQMPPMPGQPAVAPNQPLPGQPAPMPASYQVPSTPNPPATPLVLGIISIVVAVFLGFPFGVFFGIPCIIGIVMAIAGLVMSNNLIKVYGSPIGTLQGARVCSIIGLVLSILTLLFWVIIFVAALATV